MFKLMRRIDRQLTTEAIQDLLKNGSYGILSTIGSNGYPSPTPLNYVYYQDSIYLHSAVEGQKLENISQCEKVSFCVVGEVELLPDKFSTKYQSVVIYGKATEVLADEKDAALQQFIIKYSSQFLEQGKQYIQKAIGATRVIKIDIEHLTGKARS